MDEKEEPLKEYLTEHSPLLGCNHARSRSRARLAIQKKPPNINFEPVAGDKRGRTIAAIVPSILVAAYVSELLEITAHLRKKEV